MASPINLKELEKQAFRSTYQDGLWDIYYGLIVVFLTLFLDRPDDDLGWVYLLLMAVSFIICQWLLNVGKKYITIPRLGQVTFGAIRKQKKRNMSIILGIIVFIQVVMLVVTMFGWLNPGFGAKLHTLFAGSNDLLLVSTIGALIVCTGMSVKAYFSDFMRGYYIALLMGLAVFMILYFQQPIFPFVIGILILLPGVMLLVRFLQHYPLPGEEVNHE